MKIAFVLPGGGLKGAYQAGAVEALTNQGIVPDVVAGVSVGALNAAIISTGNTKALRSLWRSVYENPKTIFDDSIGRLENGVVSISLMGALRSFLRQYGIAKALFHLATKNPGLSNAFIRSLGRGLVDNNGLRLVLDANFTSAHIPLLSSFVSLIDGRVHDTCDQDYATRGDLLNGIIASTTMPGICEPVKEIHFSNGTTAFQCVDGGIRNVAPLSQTLDYIKAHPDRWTIYIISTSNRYLPDLRTETIVDIVGSTIDVMLNEILVNDIETCLRYNELAELDPKRVRVSLKLIEPAPGELGGTLDHRNIPRNYDKGLRAEIIDL